MPPGPRAGFSMCVHKKPAVLFEGVVDMESEGILWSYERISLLKTSKGSTRNEPAKDSASSSKDCQDDIEMSEAIDGDELEDYEDPSDMQCGTQDVSYMTKTLSLNDVASTRVSDVKVQGLSCNSDQQACSSLETVKPCGRINTCMVVGKDMLYMYGGMMEVKDREIALDDLYSLNLSKLDEWKCVIPASESEWLEVSEEDDDTEDEARK